MKLPKRVLFSLILLLALLAACTGLPALPNGPDAPPVVDMATESSGQVVAAQELVANGLPATPLVEENAPAGTDPTPNPQPTARLSVATPPRFTATPTATPVPCLTPGRVVSETVPSQLAYGSLDVRVFLPPCYSETGQVYPTLYMFAGNTQDESFWDEAGLDEAANEAMLAGEMAPFIIVMADGGWVANNSSGGPNSYEGVIMTEVIPYIEANYCASVHPSRRAIGGLSRGGYWSLEIAFQHPDKFVSVGGHSAALIDSAAGPNINPQYTALSNDLGDLRIYLDIGQDDYLLPNTLRLHEDMAAAGIPHEWHLNEGTHENSYWISRVAEYLDWYAQPWRSGRETYPLCDLN